MKRALCILLLSVLCFTTPALALNGQGYNTGSEGSSNVLCGQIDGQTICLSFDSSANYSFIAESSMQLCFFAFDAAQDYYLECYLVLPDSVRAGTIVEPATGGNADATGPSVSLFEISDTNNDFYFAGQYEGNAYPANSSFTIRCDTVETINGSIHIAGSVSAKLAAASGSDFTGGTVQIEDAAFDFTIPLSQSEAAPAESAQPEPGATNDPGAKANPFFTLPPDVVAV